MSKVLDLGFFAEGNSEDDSVVGRVPAALVRHVFLSHNDCYRKWKSCQLFLAAELKSIESALVCERGGLFVVCLDERRAVTLPQAEGSCSVWSAMRVSTD